MPDYDYNRRKCKLRLDRNRVLCRFSAVVLKNDRILVTRVERRLTSTRDNGGFLSMVKACAKYY